MTDAPLIGYRAFLVDNNSHVRSPVFCDYAWKPGWNLSVRWGSALVVGNNDSAYAPSETNKSGFYALNTPQQARDTSRLLLKSQLVLGQVEAAGQVVIHENGFRAEYMRVLAIEDGVSEHARFAAAFFGVPLRDWFASDELPSDSWMMTPKTRVVQAPSDFVTYNVTTMTRNGAAVWSTPDAPIMQPVSFGRVAIRLDQTRYGIDGTVYQWGYNSEHDILVWKIAE